MVYLIYGFVWYFWKFQFHYLFASRASGKLDHPWQTKPLHQMKLHELKEYEDKGHICRQKYLSKS
jgi:hypothetical protein